MDSSNATEQEFPSYLAEVRQAGFSGWDFSYVQRHGGENETPPEWSYPLLLRTHLSQSACALDLGTGGGEFLASLQPFPPRMTATESYVPNLPIAKARLEPLGVRVVGVECGRQEAYPLPFKDGKFDFIANRHEAYDSREIVRLLSAGGRFITQQVGFRNNENLRMAFGFTHDGQETLPWDLSNAVSALEEAGLTILLAKEHLGHSRFYDFRALAYMFKILPWEFPDFQYQHHEQQLYELYRIIREQGYFDATLHRFLVIAEK